MAYAAVTSLLETIFDLVYPGAFLAPASRRIAEFAYMEAFHFQQILKELDKSSSGCNRKKVNALDARIKEEFWKFEDLLESHVYNQKALAPSDSDRTVELNLEELLHDVESLATKLIEMEVEYVRELRNMATLPEDEGGAASESAADSGGGRRKFKLVGNSSYILSSIIRNMMDYSPPVTVVPVVGMAGIGKTAVAREVFDDPLLLSELKIDLRAWVAVGRRPELVAIKRDILTQLDPASSRDGRDVDKSLKRIFKANKRCLLVLDDVWDSYVWDEMRPLFPDYGLEKNFVLITSRLRHVAFGADKRWFGLRWGLELLDEQESWDLLRQRVFGEDEFPADFVKSGQKIAKECDGLPLMIVTVAALLSDAEMTAEFWEEVAKKEGNHPIFTVAYDRLYEVLFPSYDYLPQHLKPCFLHMGVGLPKSNMRRSNILSMWIAEGFVRAVDHKTKEDCYETTFLRELIDHSVAIICRRSSNRDEDIGLSDGIKSCRLHSTFWHLCRREATATKFCRVLTFRDDGLQQLVLEGQRRLSFHNSILFAMKDVMDLVKEACANSARSLICCRPSHPYPVPFCSGLRLLKLLYLDLRFYEFPEQVMQLVFLRYLGLNCSNALPPSISRLRHLRFLSIHKDINVRFSGVTPYVPVEIWDMKELQRIYIWGRNLTNPPPRDDKDAASLESLLSLVGVGVETCTREILEGIPNLTKLGIQIASHPDEEAMEQVQGNLNNIHLLNKLRSLKCFVQNPILSRNHIIAPTALKSMFPSTLIKLSLYGLGYPWECMSTIGWLPNLQSLKLECYAFRGPKWVVRYGQFRALIYLQISETDLVHFKVDSMGLIKLKMLKLKYCYKLKHFMWIPDDHRPHSFDIVMHDCHPSAATYAKEMSSKGGMVIVKSSWEDGE